MKVSLRVVILAGLLIALASVNGESQSSSPGRLNAALAAARSGILNYRTTFTNLLANEKRVFYEFDSKGRIRRRREVRSTFIVYPLTARTGAAEEFRQVVEVDGKPVEDAAKRAEEFFAKLSRSATDDETRARIQRESYRYDLINVIGYTTSPGICLLENVENAFRFELQPADKINDRSIVRIDCEQIAPSSAIKLSDKDDLPDITAAADIYAGPERDKLADLRIKATIWLDADSMQIVGESREYSVRLIKLNRRELIQRVNMVFRESPFGIMTPESISIDIYRPEDKAGNTRLTDRIEIYYSEFSKPDIEIRVKS